MNIDDINMETGTVPNTNFLFSGARPEDLSASEQTLATVVVDASGSTGGFKSDLVMMLNTIVKACKKSPRAENILLRAVRFDDTVNEINGFAPIGSIADYDADDLDGGGMTALIDASLSGIGAMNAYGKMLIDLDYSVNGILFVITDGDENRSIVKDPSRIKTEIEKAVCGETIRGITTILVGINIAEYRDKLKKFKEDAGFDYFVEVADATPQRLAKFAGFVSKSISSSSQSLAKGQSSVTVDPNDLFI
jgi:hypothetical protein